MQAEKKYKPVITYIKWMLVSYIYEVAKFDVEIASALRKKPTILPQGSTRDIKKMKIGKMKLITGRLHFRKVQEREEAFRSVYSHCQVSICSLQFARTTFWTSQAAAMRTMLLRRNVIPT